VTSPRGLTYDALCSLYVQCVDRKYGKATVVFDGYHYGPSTMKDSTHERRAGVYGLTVTFESDMVAKVKKDEFFVNKVNKKRFTNHLGGQTATIWLHSYPSHRGRRSTNRPDRRTVCKIGADSACG